MIRTALIAATSLAVLLAAGAASAGEVTVTLTGVQARGGSMLVSLQSRDQFMQRAMTAGTVRENPAAGTLTLTLPNVPEGEYALSALHDADGNWTMTMDGQRPGEGWAMSRVGAELNRRPTFADAVVRVPAQGATITAAMVYPASR